MLFVLAALLGWILQEKGVRVFPPPPAAATGGAHVHFGQHVATPRGSLYRYICARLPAFGLVVRH